MTFKIGYITHYDLDGITTLAELKIHEQNGKNESSAIYTSHRDLLSHLLRIDSKIDKLYITDLVVPGTIDISDELYRIANQNPKKYRRDKITIITDKKVRSNIKKISGVYVYSAEWAQNHNQSTSQMAYNYINEKKGQEPDNICGSLALLGAAGDGLLPKSILYNDTIEQGILLDNAIRQNKKDPLFLDKIVLELTKHGSIEDVNLKKKIEADSETFKTEIDKAYKRIIDGNTYEDEHNRISIIESGDTPIGVATSKIRSEKKIQNVIVFIENNHGILNEIVMRGYKEHSLDPVLGALKKYKLRSGGHDGNRPTRYIEVPNDPNSKIIQEITSFCSNPPVNET